MSAPIQGVDPSALFMDRSLERATGAAEAAGPTREPHLSAAERTELRKAAGQFESLFVQMLVRQMREAQLEDGFFGEGSGTSVYEGMFETFLGDSLGAQSPLGIASLLLDQWGIAPEEKGTVPFSQVRGGGADGWVGARVAPEDE